MLNAMENLEAAYGALKAALGVGIQFKLDNDALVLEANSVPPLTIIEELNRHKHQIIASLKPIPTEPTDADWPLYFHQRFMVAEVIEELSAEEAQTEAFNWCVVAWLNQHVETSGSSQCAWCGKPDQPIHIVVPFGNHLRGLTWLHPECWRAWQERRRSEAVKALRANGIHYPELRE